MKYKIYKLIDPSTNEIRYVGRTIQKLNNRLKKHINANDKSYRVNWIKSLLNKNLEPIIKLICETNSFDVCCRLEQFYIQKYKKEGLKLVNMTNGGEGSIGFKHSAKSKEKISIKTKLRMSNPEIIEELRINGKKQWENKSDDEKLKNQLNQKGRRNIKQLSMSGELIKEFISLREIERELGYFRANITPCLRGEFKQAYGFIWIYSD